ncbi:MAG: F0F1 ATP synthase subunit B [Bacteroidales bacterium]
MELVTPGLGLVFWMTIAFGIVLYILRKYAWHPIMSTIQEREDTIAQALRDAKRIQDELLVLENKKLDKLEEAQKEYHVVLSHARAESEEILRTAHKKADQDARQMMEGARQAIEQERQKAMLEVKSQVALLSLDIAEKVLEEKFAQPQQQKNFINSMLDKVNLN